MLAFQHSHPAKAERVEQVPEFVQPSINRALKALPYFENALTDREYLVTDHLTFADIVLYLGLDFGKALKVNPLKQGENLARFYKSMHERFSIKALAKPEPKHAAD